jgi:tetratricopeptide (TPR) repeat protein
VFFFAAACAQHVPVSDYKKRHRSCKNKQNEQAIALFNAAATTEKDKDIIANALYNNAGLCYGITGKYEEEISYYKKAIEHLTLSACFI